MEYTETTIKPATDARPEFAERLEKIMMKKGVFNPEAHIYLTNTMMSYVNWSKAGEEPQFRPDIHTRTTDPFIFQMRDAGEQLALNSSLQAKRLQSIGDTVLFAVGYWPESVSSIMVGEKVIRERPNLEYFASVGATAYSRAARARQRTRIYDRAADIMRHLAEEFRQYAGVLFAFRQETGDLPPRDHDFLVKMWEFLKDDDVFNRYALPGFSTKRVKC
ncbi:hypothetical protein KY359_00520 [Candidatus Woesearchaeota archaeon]|nr:hypothetical protein [Candidatus Woesearchaeota archaeon]